MPIRRDTLITLHRVDTKKAIFVKADSVTAIEDGEEPGTALVYAGRLTRVVSESPKIVKCFVERAVR